MSNAHTIHEIIALGTKLQSSPATPTIAHNADFAVLGLEGSSTGKDFRAADLLAVPCCEIRNIEELVDGGIGECFNEFVFWDRFATIAGWAVSNSLRGKVLIKEAVEERRTSQQDNMCNLLLWQSDQPTVVSYSRSIRTNREQEEQQHDCLYP